MRTVFTFRSPRFNSATSREYFINPGCFGDDAARWLGDALRARGLEADAEPGQEDFGWYFDFTVPEGEHCCVIGFRPDDDGTGGVWIGWVEREAGFLKSLLGGRKRGIAATAVEALHAALNGAPDIDALAWHRRADFDAGREELGASTPDAD